MAGQAHRSMATPKLASDRDRTGRGRMTERLWHVVCKGIVSECGTRLTLLFYCMYVCRLAKLQYALVCSPSHRQEDLHTGRLIIIANGRQR
jgi:hypothetical protein